MNKMKCRVSTTSTDAALIPLAGFVFGAIDPANNAGEGYWNLPK